MKKTKKFIYLISPNKIKNNYFYIEIEKIFSKIEHDKKPKINADWPIFSREVKRAIEILEDCIKESKAAFAKAKSSIKSELQKKFS